MADEIKSLERYDANKVISAVNAFYTHVRKFDDVASSITSLADDIEKDWKGTAGEMFSDKFEAVYGQVVDISDALFDIYEMLQQAQDAFYQADDSLRNSYMESQHNSSKSSGGGSSSTTYSYKEMSTLQVVPHNTPEAYVPNVALPPMSPLPVLSSTIGDSYHPAFFYDAFTKLPVVSHGVPSPLIISMLYDNKTVKDVIKHNVGEATEAVFAYDLKSPLDITPHDVPEAFRPEMYHGDMSPLPVEPHNTPDAERPEFAYDTMAPQPVEPHNTPDAVMPEFAYDAKTPLPVEPHNTPDAVMPEFTYDAKTPLPVEPHNTPDPYVPTFTYAQMLPVGIEGHNVADAFFPWMGRLTSARKNRLMSAVSISVSSTLTDSVLKGKTIDEAKLAVGETVVSMLKPNHLLTGDVRNQLVKQMGESVFNAVCGENHTSLIDAVQAMSGTTDFQVSKDAVNQSVAMIMNGAALPGMKPGTVSADVSAADIRQLNPGMDLRMYGTTPVIKADNMLGEAGTQGIDPSLLNGGLQNVSKFSLKMSAIRALGAGMGGTDGMAATDGSISVVSVMPSVLETNVSFENGEISWQLTGVSDQVLQSAVVNFSEKPLNVSGNEANLLQQETVRSIEVSAIKVPEITISLT